MSSPSYLPDSSLCVYLFLICIGRYCDAVLTVGACFVDKIAEIEQGGPGSQVLNEPLRKRKKTQQAVITPVKGSGGKHWVTTQTL